MLFRSEHLGTDKGTSMTRKCFRCGSDQHMKRECPLAMHPSGIGDETVKNTRKNWKGDKSQTDERKKEELHSRIVCSVNEPGAYVTAKIHEMDTYLLMDTGATVSILSRACYENIQGYGNYMLESINKDVFSANGSLLRIYGKVSIKFMLNGIPMHHEMIVADVSVDGILGLDFLIKHEAIVNLRTRKVEIAGIEHPIQLEGTAHEYKVALVRRIIIPPRSEVIAEGAI